MSGRLGFSDLVLRAQAPRAQVKMLCLAIDIDSSRVDIGRPAAVGVAFGVADIMTELRCFPAYIALQFSLSPSIFEIDYCKFYQFIVS
jgi:hypothetical protein